MVELRDQMAETTKQINAMTGEYVAMKESAHQYDSLIASLQQENDRVRGLLEELVQDKKNKEKQMDQVEAEVEKRIGQMTDILEFKVSFVLSRTICRLGCLSQREPSPSFSLVSGLCHSGIFLGALNRSYHFLLKKVRI